MCDVLVSWISIYLTLIVLNAPREMTLSFASLQMRYVRIRKSMCGFVRSRYLQLNPEVPGGTGLYHAHLDARNARWTLFFPLSIPSRATTGLSASLLLLTRQIRHPEAPITP
jgi:hypothetical protein